MTSSTKHLRGAPSGTCQGCGRYVDRLELDHIDPLWNGGSNSNHNLQWLCEECHTEKTRREQSSWAYKVRDRRNSYVPLNPTKRAHHRFPWFTFIVLCAMIIMAMYLWSPE